MINSIKIKELINFLNDIVNNNENETINDALIFNEETGEVKIKMKKIMTPELALKKIQDAYKDLVFEEKEHLYYNKENGNVYESVTTKLKKFKKEFDSVKIAKIKAEKLNIHYQKLIDRWNLISIESTSHGNRIHNFAEMYPNFDNPRDLEEEGVIEAYKYFENNGYVIIGNEVRIYDDTIGVAGSIDLLLYNTNSNTLAIGDWKTGNKSILKYSKTDSLNEPFSEWKSSKLNEYSIQLGYYKTIIEKTTDLKVEDMYIITFLKEQGGKATIYEGYHNRTPTHEGENIVIYKPYKTCKIIQKHEYEQE